MARVILDYLRRINEEDGVTVICNLHMPELAREYGRRIIALKAGKAVFDGPAERFDDAIARNTYEPA